MSEAANRHLLFGVLALQNHFIDEESLLEAFRIWTLNTSRELGDILVGNGKLSRAQKELLDALLHQHLAQHGDDSEKSLAAISSVPPIHASLRELNATELFEGLQALPETQVSHSHRRTKTDPIGTTTRRFRVLRSHAKGGLGEVFVAEDIELRREVALKEIQPQYADYEQSRTRFLLEAEITGGLEHPGIVPVYGLGQYADGRPYYAMRFIRGDSLADAIHRFHQADQASRDSGERTVELRKLVGRFVDVCEAMEYAHSRGVLHRDLKPGNIMLGRYGETLVVDWGLAKALGRNDSAIPSQEPVLLPQSGSRGEQTMQGSALGTPAYMSPEQASGHLELLGPASDVYSLGATLYCLLTGKAPFSGRDTLENVKKGNWIPPRSLNDRVPHSLNAICIKSMALDPAARYSSPRGLADDIERWLADEPVSCYSEPLLIRVHRWARRHPAIVVGSSVALIVGLLSASAIGFILARTNDQLRGKNQELADANQREVQLTKQAEKSAAIAKSQSQLALKSLQTVVFDIQRKLENQPGAGDLRRTLLKAALLRLEEVSKEFVDGSEVDLNTAAALLDLSDTFRRFGTEGSQESEESGYMATAFSAVQRAHRIYEELANASPDNPNLQYALAMVLDKLGDTELQLGRSDDALRSFEKSLTIREQRSSRNPDDQELQTELSWSYTHIGDVQMQAGQMIKALDSFAKSLAMDQKTAERDTRDEEAQRSLAISYDRVASVLLKIGKAEEAMEKYRQSHAIDSKLAESHPEDRKAQRDLAHAFGNLGDVHLQLIQLANALQAFEKSQTILQKLVEQDPSDTVMYRDLSIYSERIGDVLLDMGNMEEALQNFQKGLEISLEIGRRDQDDVWAQRDVAYSHNKVGDALLKMDRYSEALAEYKKALIVREKLATDANDAMAQRELSISHGNIGDVHFEADEYVEALDAFTKGSMISERLLVEQPDEFQVQRDAKIALTKLGDTQLALNQIPDARESYDKMLKLALQMSAASPEDTRTKRDLAGAWQHLAVFRFKLEEYQLSLEAHQKALDIFDALSTHEQSLEALSDLLASLLWIGRTCLAQGQTDQALEHWRRLKKLVEETTLLDERTRHAWLLKAEESILKAEEKLRNP